MLITLKQTTDQRIWSLSQVILTISIFTIQLLVLLPLRVYANEHEHKAFNEKVSEEWVGTAFCRCKKCTLDGDGITASGKLARAGHTVAMNGLPFGTRVRINGKVYVVEDRGAVSQFGSRQHPKKRVDIFVSDHAEALRFGRQRVKLEVLNG